jgi:hypothetical protein
MDIEPKPLEQRIYDGARAREVLENEAFQQVFADVEKDLIESWKNIPASPDHVAARERIHLSLTLLGKVKACLEASMETGRLAEMDLEHRNKVQQLAAKAKASLGWG